MNFFKSLMNGNGVSQMGSDDAGLSNLKNIVNNINTILTAALGILTAAVVILAIFIAFKFFTADDDTKRKNAKNQLIYAIIGVVVLVALTIFAPMIVKAIGSSLENKSMFMF